MHPVKEIVLFPVSKSNIIFGAIVEEQQPSMRDKKDRKKYMGEPRAWVLVIVTIMSRLPTRVRK
jgi:hypothetical protein